MDKQTGLSKGFGFIKMLNDEEANAAITALNGKKIGGNIIRVRLVQSS
jgi:RNA recognition motif-containing protein